MVEEGKAFPDLLDALADAWGVPRAIVRATVKGKVTRRTFNDRRGRYVAVAMDPTEAQRHNMPPTSVVIRSLTGADWHCAVHQATYKDKDGIDRPTACAYSREYLGEIGLATLKVTPRLPAADPIAARLPATAPKRDILVDDPTDS